MKLHDAIRKKFRFLGRTDNLPWSAPRSSRNGLAELFFELGFNKGVEIGVRAGAYSMVLCKANPNIDLTCVDPWIAYGRLNQARQDEFFKEAVKNLTPFNVKILKKTSMKALSDFEDESLDFVFIDGNHEFDYCCPDIIFWSQKVKQGGIVAVHDYYNFHWAGVVQAIDAYTRSHHIDPWYVTRDREATAFWGKP